MKAMLLKEISPLEGNPSPLSLEDVPPPEPGDRQVLIRVSRCGVCHTELDEIEGRTLPPGLPVIPGHQLVGRVAGLGPGAVRFKEGNRVGVGWIYSSCGHCDFCRAGLENLCPDFRATGRDAHGGYAEYAVVPENAAFPVPESLTDSEAAPLLCAGAIGYRALRLANIRDGDAVGLSGFGASGHLVLSMIRKLYPHCRVFVFTRSGQKRELARGLGASWTGGPEEEAPLKLGAIIDTTPAWGPVVHAMGNLAPGGRLVINAIRKEDRDKEALMELDYARHLWMEKQIRTVANITRRDIGEFLPLAADMAIKADLEEFPLEEANRALRAVREGAGKSAKVLVVEK